MHQNPTNKMNYNECITKGICTVSPAVSFLQEVIKLYLKDLSFYLLKLKEFGISNEKIREDVIDIISGLIVDVYYNEEQFSKIITNLNTDLSTTKELYNSLCSKNNIESENVKTTLRLPKKMSLSDATMRGQKIFTAKNKKTTDEQKTLFDIMFAIMKSICIHLVELKDLNTHHEEAYETLLILFNARNTDISVIDLHKIIEQSVKLDYFLLQTLHETRTKFYGELTSVDVTISTRPNKAILVSGTNLRELELLLEATKNKNIDIYTHGHMLMAHAYPKLKAYPHLIGHFGKDEESYLIDFAAFPGAIFLTKHSFHRLENFYRGRIYTTDLITPMGVVSIKTDNFEPLIEAALSAKGFTTEKEYSSVKINLDEKKIMEKISDVAEKIEKKEIKYFFALGVSDGREIQKAYCQKILELLGNDCFVLSFTYNYDSDNVLVIDSDLGFPILYKSLEIITRKIDISDLDPIILFTKCEEHTISNVINMKYMGIKKIYFADCSPIFVNPALIEAIREIYNLKDYTTPEEDLKMMLNKDM